MATVLYVVKSNQADYALNQVETIEESSGYRNGVVVQINTEQPVGAMCCLVNEIQKLVTSQFFYNGLFIAELSKDLGNSTINALRKLQQDNNLDFKQMNITLCIYREPLYPKPMVPKPKVPKPKVPNPPDPMVSYPMVPNPKVPSFVNVVEVETQEDIALQLITTQNQAHWRALKTCFCVIAITATFGMYLPSEMLLQGKNVTRDKK